MLKLLTLLLPLASSLILPFDDKQVDYSNTDQFAFGLFGQISTVEIDGEQFAIKTQQYSEEAIVEIATMLFVHLLSIQHVTPALFVTFTNENTLIGMEKMPSDAEVIEMNLEDMSAEQELVLSQINEQTLINIIEGVAKLNEIGIYKTDNYLNNILLNIDGSPSICDFSKTEFLTPISTVDYYSRKGEGWIFTDYKQIKKLIHSFLTFFESYRMFLENDWSKISEEFGREFNDAKTTVYISKLIREGAFRLGK